MTAPPVRAVGDTGHVADHNLLLPRVDEARTITAARSSAGTEAPASVFAGDFSSTLGSGKLTLSGTALPSPATGYKYTPEATAHYVVLVNSTGHNESLSANSGRTSATAHRTMVWHTGQGDAVAYNAYVDVDSTPQVGSTHWLANAAGVILNGQVEIKQAHLYANPVEINLSDNGFDAAGIGAVFNINRTVGTASLGEVWMGVRVQSIGTSDADVGFSLSGGFKRGLDMTRATLATGKAAVTIKADDRIYLASTSSPMNGVSWYSTTVGTEWIGYASASTGTEIVSQGVRALLVAALSGAASNHVTITASGTAARLGTNTGDLDLRPFTNVVQMNGTQILTTRRTGYTNPMTGTVNRATAYDTSTVTLAQLAGRVMALQADLTTHGLIGA